MMAACRHLPAALLLGFAICAVPRAWCLDGARIVFAAQSEEGTHIYVMDPDGIRTEALTAGPRDMYVAHPSWSSDGQAVAFQEFWLGLDPRKPRIYRMDADGSGKTPLSEGPWDAYPSWAPGD